MAKQLVQIIPLHEKHIVEIMLHTGIAVKILQANLLDCRRTGQLGIFTIADVDRPRTRY